MKIDKDQVYVNFSQDHELNNHLKKIGKKQSDANRATLKKWGEVLRVEKEKQGKKFVTHEEFEVYAAKKLGELE